MPDSSQPAAVSFNAGTGPRSAQFPTAEENDVGAYGISTITSHQIIRVHYVTAALAHLFAVFTQDHALVAQLQHGFITPGDAAIAGSFMEETSVDQVHGGMLRAARVGIDRHPIVVLGWVKRSIIIIGAQVAQVVPAGAHEGVHGVGFTFGRLAALWTSGEAPGGMQLERTFASRQPFHVIRQQYR